MCSWYAPLAPKNTAKEASTFSASPFSSSFGSSLQTASFQSYSHSRWLFCSNLSLKETSLLEEENY